MKWLSMLMGCSILIISCISCNWRESKEDDLLSLFINLDKNVYEANEPIFIYVTLNNHSKDDLIVKKRLALVNPWHSLKDITIKITSPKGQELDFQAKVDLSLPSDEDFLKISPGESIRSKDFNLQKYYQFDIPGTYSIIATYENLLDPSDGRIAWKGKLSSKIVKLEYKP